MFRPLAWTKTLAMAFSSMLAITVVPVLMLLFIRGRRLRPRGGQSHLAFLHRRFICRSSDGACAIARSRSSPSCAVRAATLPLLFKIGSQFMPPLYEGSMLYMPTALPGHFDRLGVASDAGAGSDHPRVSRGRERLRHGRTLRQRDRQRADWTCSTRRSC